MFHESTLPTLCRYRIDNEYMYVIPYLILSQIKESATMCNDFREFNSYKILMALLEVKIVFDNQSVHHVYRTAEPSIILWPRQNHQSTYSWTIFYGFLIGLRNPKPNITLSQEFSYYYHNYVFCLLVIGNRWNNIYYTSVVPPILLGSNRQLQLSISMFEWDS